MGRAGSLKTWYFSIRVFWAAIFFSTFSGKSRTLHACATHLWSPHLFCSVVTIETSEDNEFGQDVAWPHLGPTDGSSTRYRSAWIYHLSLALLDAHVVPIALLALYCNSL